MISAWNQKRGVFLFQDGQAFRQYEIRREYYHVENTTATALLCCYLDCIWSTVFGTHQDLLPLPDAPRKLVEDGSFLPAEWHHALDGHLFLHFENRAMIFPTFLSDPKF
jgi:hypothetical protein